MKTLYERLDEAVERGEITEQEAREELRIAEAIECYEREEQERLDREGHY